MARVGPGEQGARPRNQPVPDLPLFWDEPKLLEDTQIIVAFPLLCYLAIRDAVYGDTF